MRFKIDWASLVVGSKFTVFALLYFVFEGNFPSASPRGAYIWRGDLRDWSKSIGGGGGEWAGAFGKVVDKKHMAHPLPSAQK